MLGGEDCLVVHVFSPATLTGEKDEEQMSSTSSSKIVPADLLPVIVFVHGGGFLGGITQDKGPHYLMDEDVVLVSLQYRQGILGFLNFQDDIVQVVVLLTLLFCRSNGWT